MIKRKPQLHEEIQKMDYLLGYDKDFSYDEGKRYNEKKHITESKQLLKTTNTRNSKNGLPSRLRQRFFL